MFAIRDVALRVRSIYLPDILDGGGILRGQNAGLNCRLVVGIVISLALEGELRFQVVVSSISMDLNKIVAPSMLGIREINVCIVILLYLQTLCVDVVEEVRILSFWLSRYSLLLRHCLRLPCLQLVSL